MTSEKTHKFFKAPFCIPNHAWKHDDHSDLDDHGGFTVTTVRNNDTRFRDDVADLKTSRWLLLPTIAAALFVMILSGLLPLSSTWLNWPFGTVASMFVAVFIYTGALWLTIQARFLHNVPEEVQHALDHLVLWEDRWAALMGSDPTEQMTPLLHVTAVSKQRGDAAVPIGRTSYFSKPAGGFSLTELRQKLDESCYSGGLQALIEVHDDQLPDTAASFFKIWEPTDEFGEWAQKRQSHWSYCSASWQVTLNKESAYLDLDINTRVAEPLFYRQLAKAFALCGLPIPQATSSLIYRNRPPETNGTGPGSSAARMPFIQYEIKPADKLTAARLYANQEVIADVLRLHWLRFKVHPGQQKITLYGCPKHPDFMLFPPNVTKRMRDLIRKLDLEDACRKARLAGKGGTEWVTVSDWLTKDKSDPDAVDCIVQLPPGLTLLTLRSSVGALSAAYGQNIRVEGRPKPSEAALIIEPVEKEPTPSRKQAPEPAPAPEENPEEDF